MRVWSTDTNIGFEKDAWQDIDENKAYNGSEVFHMLFDNFDANNVSTKGWKLFHKMWNYYDNYADTDYEAVEGYEIDKIALPVKSLDDHEEDCKFTVYVVEGDKDSGWEKVEEHKLVIKANTYDEDDVNKWVTFNVNIKVEEGQTLAFGSAKDTVVLAYDGGASSVKNFYKNVFETPELVPAALYIDIYGWEIE